MKRALMFAAVGVLLAATSWIAVPVERTYLVNTGSFVQGFSSLGGDPLQAIQYAAQHWAAYAGTYEYFKRAGFTSTAYSCTAFGPNVVEGFPTTVPMAMNCNTLAQLSPCVGGGWGLQVAGCANHTLGLPASAANPDFHFTMVHEFGHAILRNGSNSGNGGHLANSTNGDDATIMSAGGGADFVFNGFGTADITALGGPGLAVWGDGYVNAGVTSAVSVGSPLPTGFTSFQAPGPANRWVGLGGFDYQRGFGEDFFVQARVTPEPHRVESSSLWGGDPPQIPTPNAGSSFAAPVLIRDTYRNQWWMISRDGVHNNYAHLFKRTFVSGVMAWQDFGAIPDIVSKYSVGADYSWAMDRIVVVWANGRGDVPSVPRQAAPARNCTHRRTGSGTQPFGCQGEYLVTLINPVDGSRVSTTRFLVGGDATVAGYSGLGAPAVVCDTDLCEVSVTSRDANRQIVSWGFVPNQTGISNYFARVAQAGSTDFAVSYSTLPAASGNRVIVQSVLGRDDRNIYFRSRQTYFNSWNGWTNAKPGTASLATPVVSLDPQTNQYNLVVSY